MKDNGGRGDDSQIPHPVFVSTGTCVHTGQLHFEKGTHHVLIPGGGSWSLGSGPLYSLLGGMLDEGVTGVKGVRRYFPACKRVNKLM